MQIKQHFSFQLVFGYAYFVVCTRPFFDRSIDRVTRNCCYKHFKYLQTYQIGLEKDEKLKICYNTPKLQTFI